MELIAISPKERGVPVVIPGPSRVTLPIVTGKVQLPLTPKKIPTLVKGEKGVEVPTNPPAFETLVTEVGSNKVQLLSPTVSVQAARPGKAERMRGVAIRALKALIREKEDMEELR